MKHKKIFVLFLFALSSFSFANVYKSNVQASYYAEKYHGRKTANGETFNMYAMTCAHKTLPFGTILRVTNLKNNKTVDVRVNDRGPFVKGREIDVSKAAAQKLGMIKTGTASVRIEIVDKNASVSQVSKSTQKKSDEKVSPKSDSKMSAGFWDVQVASFSSRENANRLAQNLLREGFENVYFQKTSSVVRVVIKKVPDSKLPSVESQLRAIGQTDYIVKRNS